MFNNMKKIHNIIAILLVIALFAADAGAAEKKIKVIRVGSTAPGHLKFVLGNKLGFWEKEFEKDGIKYEFYPFVKGGSEAITALASRGLEIAYTGADPTLRASGAGADIALVGLSSFNKSTGEGTGTCIAVAKDSPIKTLEDLKGAKIAFLTGTMRHATLTRALKLVGLSGNDVDGLDLPFEASGPALLRGDIDAVVEGYTNFAVLLRENKIRVIFDSSKYQWEVPSAITVNGEFLREHPDLLKRHLKVDLAISEWADAHYDEAIAIFAEWSGRDAATIAKEYPDKKFFQAPEITEEAINSFKEEADFLVESGLATGKVDFGKWVRKTIIDEVYAEHGK